MSDLATKADVAELVDARDLKSLDGNVVWVRVPPPAPNFFGNGTMAIERLTITPSVITWARKRAGLSLEEAKNFGRIDEWESGASSPTYAQIEALASALKVPVAVFFFPEPPDLPNLAQSFRTLPDVEFDKIPSRVQLLVRKAKAFQLNLAELTAEKNPAERLIIKDLKLSADENIAAAAERVRAYLSVTLEAQQNFKTDDDALKAWRDVFHSAGLFVFKDAFKKNRRPRRGY